MLESRSEPISVAGAGFPRGLLSLLRCGRDAGPLVMAAETRSGAIGIIEGRLRCSACAAEYRIEDGIARMMAAGALTPENEHEMALRDADEFYTRPGPFVPPPHGWRSEFSSCDARAAALW
jgi:uncharacterized protein YbaR (Trm112 family)